MPLISPIPAAALPRRERLLNLILALHCSIIVGSLILADLLSTTPPSIPWVTFIPAALVLYGAIALLNRHSLMKAAGLLIVLTLGITLLAVYNAPDEHGIISASLHFLTPVVIAAFVLGPWATCATGGLSLGLLGLVGLTTNISLNGFTLVLILHLSIQPLLAVASWVWAQDVRDLEEQANQRETSLADVTHELRTPLNGIMGLTELTLSTALTDEQQRYLRMVRSSATGLLHLINDLLDMAKARAGTLSVFSTPFDPHIQVQLVSESLRPQAEAKGLELRVEVEDLPSALLGDSVRVRQILVNLLGNAIKYTDHGYVRLRVGYDERLSIDVDDTGVGIAPDRLSEIFDAFTQVAGTRRIHAGAGLGLTITAELVGLMEGSITVDSTLGEGSCFKVWLPLPVSGDEPEEDTWVGPLDLSSSLPDKTRNTALVAEDNQVNRFLLETLLRKAGWHVLVAEDGERAVALAGEADIVLMDVQMPELDGLEAARRIRAAGNDVPIIALTAGARDQDREACMEAGMNAFLSKPLRIAEVLDTVERLTL